MHSVVDRTLLSCKLHALHALYCLLFVCMIIVDVAVHATRLNAEIPSCMTEGAQTMRDVGEPIGSWKEERDI